MASETRRADPGNSVTLTPRFFIIGVRIDNPTGVSYQVGHTGFIVPSWTIGWSLDIYPAVDQLIVAPQTSNPDGSSVVARGTGITVMVNDAPIGSSPGQRLAIPLDTWLTPQFDVGAYPAGAPANGRPFLTVDTIASGYSIKARTLSITNKTASAHNIRIFRTTSPASAGGLILPGKIDPLSPAFPGIIRAAAGLYDPATSAAPGPHSFGVNSAPFATIPATATVGDRLILSVATSAFDTPNAPTGWTILHTNFQNQCLYTKVATATDAATIAQCTSITTGTWSAVVLHLPGWITDTLATPGTAVNSPSPAGMPGSAQQSQSITLDFLSVFGNTSTVFTIPATMWAGIDASNVPANGVETQIAAKYLTGADAGASYAFTGGGTCSGYRLQLAQNDIVGPSSALLIGAASLPASVATNFDLASILGPLNTLTAGIGLMFTTDGSQPTAALPLYDLVSLSLTD